MVPQVWIRMWIWNLEPQPKPCWFAVYTGWYYPITWAFLWSPETRSEQRLLFFVVFYVGVSLPGRQTPGRGTPGVERGLEVGDRMFFYGEIENPLKNPSFSNRKCNESLKNGAEFSKWPCLGHVFCVFFFLVVYDKWCCWCCFHLLSQFNLPARETPSAFQRFPSIPTKPEELHRFNEGPETPSGAGIRWSCCNSCEKRLFQGTLADILHPRVH